MAAAALNSYWDQAEVSGWWTLHLFEGAAAHQYKSRPGTARGGARARWECDFADYLPTPRYRLGFVKKTGMYLTDFAHPTCYRLFTDLSPTLPTSPTGPLHYRFFYRSDNDLTARPNFCPVCRLITDW